MLNWKFLLRELLTPKRKLKSKQSKWNPVPTESDVTIRTTDFSLENGLLIHTKGERISVIVGKRYVTSKVEMTRYLSNLKLKSGRIFCTFFLFQQTGKAAKHLSNTHISLHPDQNWVRELQPPKKLFLTSVLIKMLNISLRESKWIPPTDHYVLKKTLF